MDARITAAKLSLLILAALERIACCLPDAVRRSRRRVGRDRLDNQGVAARWQGAAQRHAGASTHEVGGLLDRRGGRKLHRRAGVSGLVKTKLVYFYASAVKLGTDVYYAWRDSLV